MTGYCPASRAYITEAASKTTKTPDIIFKIFSIYISFQFFHSITDNIGRYFKEEYDADFVFVTHYPSKKRPFYAMDDPTDDKFTLSFDLLFHGLEVTTGGQRIHDYNQLKAKIAARGMEEEGMEQYLDTFKHGMPPHGGLGIGLERLTMQLLGEENVREACLFPRDLNRLEP